MQVRMGLLRKLESWEMEGFRRYWREEHSQLAKQLPGLVAYEQNHVMDSEQLGISHKRGPDHVDGISQLWFDDSIQSGQSFGEEMGLKLITDENHFIGHLRIVTAECVEVIPPPPHGQALKRMSFLRRRAHVSPDKFEHEWRVRHAAFVREMPGVVGYRQNLITHRESPKGQVVDYDSLPIDGIVELWFESTESLTAAFSSPQGVETMLHATEFIDEITTFLVDPIQIV